MQRSKVRNKYIKNYRQFLYDKTIPIFNSTKTDEIFTNNFLTISDRVQDMVKTTWDNSKYLPPEYVDMFMKDLNTDISEAVDTTRIIDIAMFQGTTQYVKLFSKNF